MLPRAHRVTDPETFRRTTRSGRRASSRALVVHLATSGAPGGTRAGFVVGRSVGNSVVRHRVQRRLRHLVADRLAVLPDGATLVVRALPSAATTGAAALAHDLDECLRRVTR